MRLLGLHRIRHTRYTLSVTPSFSRNLANLGSVVGGAFLLRFANFLMAVAIARLYGTMALGLYATALAYVTVVVTIADNGLQLSTAPEMHRHRNELGAVVSCLYLSKTLLLLPIPLILLGIGFSGTISAAIWTWPS